MEIKPFGPTLPFDPKGGPLVEWRGGHDLRVARGEQWARERDMPPGSPAMRALVDALDEPALIVEGLTVSFANEGAKTILGQGIEGRDVRLAIRHPDALAHILTGRPGEVEATGIGEVGRPWRVIVRDLGHGAAFVRMMDRGATVSAEKMRVDFVANASHELRTPLATVIGYAETLTDDAGLAPDVRDKFARTIRDEARRMLRIIEDLMSLSRIQADRFVEPSEVVELGDVVRTAVANANPLGGHGKSEFVVDVAPDLPAVKGDYSQLAQVFDNLLSNAARYGWDESSSPIEVAASAGVGFATVTVTDHGPGIAREHIPRLTERFYRVDEARSRGTGGTGLGLAIVKHIVERHRGTLEIRSEVGVGTSVSVRLPISA
jgi:two-component system, OmpR family, phosphate regulon sensor histidine kinase PhoR